MTRVPSKLGKALRDRWSMRSVEFDGRSPFGRTENGMLDFRGVYLKNVTIADKALAECDFSFAVADCIRIEQSSLVDCNFSDADLHQMVTVTTRFERTSFAGANLRMAQIGYRGTAFSCCEFSGVRVNGAGFFDTQFESIEFLGADWSGTDFGPSGFKDCRFVGRLHDVTFRGDYLLPSLRELGGGPTSVGLHRVDFSQADLHWIGFTGKCCIDQVALPADGHALLCDMALLLSLFEAGTMPVAERELLSRYLRIVRAAPMSQPFTIVSRHDLVELGGFDLGSSLFERFRTTINQLT